jgi:hypothetical protein
MRNVAIVSAVDPDLAITTYVRLLRVHGIERCAREDRIHVVEHDQPRVVLD